MKKEIKYLLIGVPILFIIGAFFHYIYEWSNNNILIGLISPVNESIWEHNKLILVPLISYWTIYYFFNKNNIYKNKWFLSLLISLITSTLLVPMLYYTYTESFGVEFLIIDILILLIALLIGQLLGIHIYKTKIDNISYLFSTFIIFIIITIYITFTIYTPKLPIFYSKTSDSYGINN